ncbi:MAG: hypothetical protein ACKO2Z_08880, partial [Sphaerospermopsis kisseleviana]
HQSDRSFSRSPKKRSHSPYSQKAIAPPHLQKRSPSHIPKKRYLQCALLSHFRINILHHEFPN